MPSGRLAQSVVRAAAAVVVESLRPRRRPARAKRRSPQFVEMLEGRRLLTT
jgi:hypothetical protein